jgi:hypothetical protein
MCGTGVQVSDDIIRIPADGPPHGRRMRLSNTSITLIHLTPPTPPPTRPPGSRFNRHPPTPLRTPRPRVPAVHWEVTTRRVDYKRRVCCCCGTVASTALVRNIKDVDYRSCCGHGVVREVAGSRLGIRYPRMTLG